MVFSVPNDWVWSDWDQVWSIVGRLSFTHLHCGDVPPFYDLGCLESRGSNHGSRGSPDLPFLAFLVFLAFSFHKEFLASLSCCPFFPRDLGGLSGKKNPCFFQWFCLPFSEKARERRFGSESLANDRNRIGRFETNLKSEKVIIRGFQKVFFVRGGDLTNWGRARAGCKLQ